MITLTVTKTITYVSNKITSDILSPLSQGSRNSRHRFLTVQYYNIVVAKMQLLFEKIKINLQKCEKCIDNYLQEWYHIVVAEMQHNKVRR